MDTKYLHTFVTIADCGSMAEAARRLDLTPAAIAAQVKALEEFLGTEIFRRSGRTVVPTESGLKILTQARELLRGVRDLQANASNDEPIGELQLGVSVTALTSILPPLLKKLFSQFPKLAIHIEPGTSSHLYHKVSTRVLDAAFIVEPQFELPKSCTWSPIIDEELLVLAPEGFIGQDPIELLRTEPFIRYDRGMWGGQLADNYLRSRKIKPNERIEIDSLNAIAAFVNQGLGVALVPNWSGPWQEGLKIIKMVLPPPVPARTIGLIWSNQGPRASLSETILKYATEITGIKK
ncbi:LysR family transcriptional regulator [Polynucleobacter sp. 71A-WALBACH]|uniref:LysR family transcriptional regulator n=1 Tax=Polynucleobacter sp. 71A-WALBACH TaxID=2689097 RepID=UPI001C0BC647|nr:LysR family transcriptional regulator [Polynucleobacter sp. 71A-WALBACH]MBU3593969.1 LysR family transcriptional regulator [Polynucleobacter sp. 71A-WALBACH]